MALSRSDVFVHLSNDHLLHGKGMEDFTIAELVAIHEVHTNRKPQRRNGMHHGRFIPGHTQMFTSTYRAAAGGVPPLPIDPTLTTEELLTDEEKDAALADAATELADLSKELRNGTR